MTNETTSPNKALAPTTARFRLWSIGYPVIAATVIPLTYILHESGHYIVGRFLGYSPILTYNSVLFPEPSIPGTSQMAVSIAGPAVDLLLTFAGIFGIIRLSRGLAPSRPWLFWVSTALSFRGIHWFAMPFASRSDESHISVLLGLPPWVFPSLWVPVAVAALWVMLRVHRRLKTMPQLGILVIACFFAKFVYMSFLGPALFPKPADQHQPTHASSTH